MRRVLCCAAMVALAMCSLPATAATTAGDNLRSDLSTLHPDLVAASLYAAPVADFAPEALVPALADESTVYLYETPRQARIGAAKAIKITGAKPEFAVEVGGWPSCT
jgi:hypothetical protein